MIGSSSATGARVDAGWVWCVGSDAARPWRGVAGDDAASPPVAGTVVEDFFFVALRFFVGGAAAGG